MNAPLPLASLPTFAEVTQETCLVCMGRRYVPVTSRDKFTRKLVTVHATCLRCNGTGQVSPHPSSLRPHP